MIRLKLTVLLLAAGLLCSYAQSQPTQVESATNVVSDAQADKEDSEDATKGMPDPQGIAPPSGKFPTTLVNLGETDAFSPYAFIVDKSTRTLTIWKYEAGNLTPVAVYPSDMGRKPGDKTVLGDLKTPEGIYFFQSRYEGGQLDFNEYGSRAFTMDYPNFFDLMENKTGSGIWLHAIPETKSLLRGSRGCVVVRDEVIQKITDFITLKKTPIVIQEKVTYITPDDLKGRRQSLNRWIDGWRKSWEAKDINSYIAYYGDQFKSLGMDRGQWREYKENLNSKYKSISVRISEPLIVVHDDEAVVRFIQAYQSDFKEDVGEKTLYLRKDGSGQYRILGEQWKSVSKKNLAAIRLTESKDSNL
ncbi:MAG: L,D-transpeptidase family protein [Bdellovibrionaceae bacterium]|nr:L,D-transpeptidase family protein [Bdellovibrionales bacterium]MCB9085803.1 L,D-transpeptidase family protein [Pseudobdellovibrionaceae bacterium]